MKQLDKELEKILAIYSVKSRISPGDKLIDHADDTKEPLAQIKSTIKKALLSEMPGGYVAKKNLNYKYIYYNQAISDCLEVVRKTLQ